MANQKNIFEKYGIKEVADVTFYRIERKNEIFEAQRNFVTSAILKGALKVKTVYPMDENGVSDSSDGYEAYVFEDAELHTNSTYDCELGETHEYSYAEQICMLFAKNQNLITKTGTRYKFTNIDTIFGNLEFSDNFSLTPNSTEKAVVLLLATAEGNIENSELVDVNSVISELNDSLHAKAYNVIYNDYAEIIVEDEMGYYNDDYLGSYNKRTNTFSKLLNKDDIKDRVLASATMWDANKHYSINDAIEALKEKKKVLDNSEDSATKGVTSISGGYKVNDTDPAVGSLTDTTTRKYSYSDSEVTSNYSLTSVLEAVNEIARTATEATELEVEDDGTSSNRAIYVRTGDSIDFSASAYIYILNNVKKNQLDMDKEGIFEFHDKNGDKRYYQDVIYAGVETLALVIIGDKGLIFVVNRYGTRDIEKMAWMVSDSGFITDSQAKRIVKNGLLHIIDVTIEDETFEAICSVKELSVRRIEKRVNHYTPVLFLDTLKVSTIEQTAENTYARGGKGNGQLIGWDFNKEITLTLQDALYTPASMSAMLGDYEGGDFTKGIKDTKRIDRTEKCVAERSFIVPAGNSRGIPSEGEISAQAVYIELATMQPYQDGTPIAEGETYLKWTRSIAYNDNSIGSTIEISADKFPGTFKVVGETFARSEATGEDQRFQFVIPKAKLSSESNTITLEADGDPVVFDMTLTVLRPDDGVMMKLIQYDVVENTEERDGSTMVKDTENLNLLDDAEMYRVAGDASETNKVIGATEY